MASNVSVIIPVFNSEKTILETLFALEKQQLKNFDVIVVNDASTDSTLKVVENFSKKSKLNLKIFSQKKKGPAAARNLGAKKSNAEIIVFLDADCVPEKNWLKKLLQSFKEKNVVAVSCGYKTKNSNSIVARFVGYEIQRRHEKMFGKSIDAVGSYSTAFRRKEFLAAGGFDESFPMASGEDFDLSFKLKQKGFKIFFTPLTFVWHYHPDSIVKYLKQQFFRGFWRVPMYLKNKEKIVFGDTYTGKEVQVQFILVNFLFISIVVSILTFNPIYFLVLFFLLIVSNLPLGFWCFKFEKKMLLVAPFIALLRSIFGTFGAYIYFLKSITK